MHACILVGHVFWWVTGEHYILNVQAGPETAQSWVLLEIMPDSVAMHASVPRWFRALSFGTLPTVTISRPSDTSERARRPAVTWLARET